MASTNQMEYRYLGSTGLQVSAISYGFGDIFDQDQLNTLILKAYELGVNFFDCAEAYGSYPGQVETLLGNALKALKVDREDIVISTKIFWGVSPFGAGDKIKVNRNGLSRKHILEGIKASLKRLQLEYVDLIFAHRYDLHTPMEEICRAFDYIVNNGYALYWGTSEWPVQRIEEAIRICEKFNLVKPVMEQPEYSMLKREKFEKEYAAIFAEHKIGSTIWSPLAAGALTGKYNTQIPEDSRLKTSPAAFLVEQFVKADKIDETRRITEALKVIADELGATTAQLALAWTLKNGDVSTAIVGARKLEQLEQNIAAIQFLSKITRDVEARIEGILKNQPEPEVDSRSWQKIQPRRKVAFLE